MYCINQLLLDLLPVQQVKQLRQISLSQVAANECSFTSAHPVHELRGDTS